MRLALNSSSFGSDHLWRRLREANAEAVTIVEERDRTLVERFVERGDAKAFSLLVTRYGELVYSTCWRILHNDADAADAAQETFYHLLKNPNNVNGSLGSWLHQVATRRAVDLIRQNSSRRRREQVYVQEAELPAGTWTEVEPLVDEALEQLPKEFRDVLVLHFLERQSMTRIAAAKGISQPTISRRVSEALQLLRQNLRERGVAVGLVPLQVLLTHSSRFVPEPLLQRLGKMAMAKAAWVKGVTGSFTGHITAVGGKFAIATLAVATVATLVWFQLPLRHDTGHRAALAGAASAPTTPALAASTTPEIATPRIAEAHPPRIPQVVEAVPGNARPGKAPTAGPAAKNPLPGTRPPAKPPALAADPAAPEPQPELAETIIWNPPGDGLPTPAPTAESIPPALSLATAEPASTFFYYPEPSTPVNAVFLGNGTFQMRARVFERDGAGLSFGRAMPGPRNQNGRTGR